MADHSHLDRKYFIDGYSYNCPYCKRGSVSYQVSGRFTFDWSNDRVVYGYVVRCMSCHKGSLHLSNFDFGAGIDAFTDEPDGLGEYDEFVSENLDNYFFFHQPTSSFSTDELIPRTIRDLVNEAEGCKNMNFPVGGSGALRKAIYEFIKDQGAEEKKDESYEDRIKQLKSKFPQVPPEYFDALSNIQDMTSNELHERGGDWKPWSQTELAYLIEVTKNVLNEVYVLPQKRKATLTRVQSLKK